MLKKPHRMRVLLLGCLFGLLAGGVVARLADLQVYDHQRYSERARRQHFKRVVIQPERGDILDRAGRPLAQSNGRLTVYIHPKYFREPHTRLDLETLGRQIAWYSGQPEEKVLRRFEFNYPVSVAERLTIEKARKVMDLLDHYEIDGRGYWLHRESVRFYPRRTAANVIGYCASDGDGDNNGIAGLELQYNEALNGRKVESVSPRSAIRQTLRPVDEEDLLSAQGNALVLTLDAVIQEAAENSLAWAIEEFEADSAGAVVMNPKSGAILAMASLPTFDNNEFSRYPSSFHRNRALTDPLETGSVAKLFTAAILLDQNLISPETPVDCEGGLAVVDGRRLRDSGNHNLEVVPFRVVMRWSSNVGINKAAQVLDNHVWYDYLKGFTFGGETGIDLPGEGNGLLYPVNKWTKFSRTSLPMGYEMALTPIQIATAVSCVVNGGELMEPYLVEEIRDSRGNVVERYEPSARYRQLRPSTSAIMRDLMEDIVLHGTGKKAQVPGFRVGGKTGTTVKSSVFDRRAYIASFAGAVPINDPEIVIYVWVDDPKTAHYASTVAAPVFRDIARTALVQLGIPPSNPAPEALSPANTIFAGGAEDPSVIEVASTDDAIYQPLQPWRADRMPMLTGKSLAEVKELLPQAARRIRLMGTGLVVDQSPIAGTPVGPHTEIIIQLSTAPSAERESMKEREEDR